MAEDTREIGGYFELEHLKGSEYHEGALALDCARSCLAYLIEARGIKTLWVPTFLCGSVEGVAREHGVTVRNCEVTLDLTPDYATFEIGEDEWLYLVDYYGQLSDEDILAARDHARGNLIVDEVMAFFRKPLSGIDTLYSCRKFFGVADGAYLYTDARIDRELEVGESHEWMDFVLGRRERPANDFYPRSAENNHRFVGQPARWMSPITHDILRAIDYDAVAATRRANFEYVAERLDAMNELRPHATDGAFMYPLLIEGGATARKPMQARKVYVSCLWPSAAEHDGVSGRLARDILPIVIDQRYDTTDLDYELEVLAGALEETRA